MKMSSSKWLLSLALALTFFHTYGYSDYLDNPDPIPGFTHDTPFIPDSPLLHGVELSGREITNSSPLIAEIDGDSSNGKEVTLAGPDGVVYVYKSDGSILWEAHTPNYGCGSGTNRVFSSAAVGDLAGDGKPKVVIGYGGFGKSDCDGGVIAFEGADGSTSWKFSTVEFAKKQRFTENFHAVYSTPSLADVDGDGDLEVGFGSFDRNVYLLNSNGTPRFYYNAADTVWSSPSFVNIDSDPEVEMIIGTDISRNTAIKPPTGNGGMLYALKTNQHRKRKLRESFRGALVEWKVAVDQIIVSGPVIADVLASNTGNEVIVASGCFFPQDSKNKLGKWIKIFSATDGTLLQTLNTQACSSSSPAIADIDNDGELEIVLTETGSKKVGGPGTSRISAWKATNPEPIWSVIPYSKSKQDSSGGNLISAVIADIDGNGSLEVIAANLTGIIVINGSDGRPLTCRMLGCSDEPITTVFAWDSLFSTPAIGDINNDGILDMIIGGGHKYNPRKRAMLYGWTNFANVLDSDPGPNAAYTAPWPMFKGNAARDGLFRE